MRDAWERVELGTLISRRTDFTTVSPESKYAILGVQRSGWGLVERPPIRGTEMKFKKLLRVERDDLVYRTITAFEAPSTVVGEEHAGRFVTPSTFPVFKVNKRRLLPDYMRLLTTWPTFHEEMSTRCTGSVLRRKTLSAGAFGSIPVSLPPLPEQARVVHLLAMLNETTAATEATVSRLATARRSVCAAAQEHGEERTLADLAEVSQGRSLPMALQGEKSGDTPWFKIADMARPHNVFGYTAAETRLDAARVLAHGGRIVEAGAVVFPRVGAAVRTEKKRLMTVAGALDENHLVLTPKPGVSSEVLLAVMESFSLTGLSQSGAVPSLNMGVIRAAKVRWTADDHGQLGEALMASRVSASRQAAHLERLRDLRANLLTALLSGAHEIPDSYDELLAG